MSQSHGSLHHCTVTLSKKGGAKGLERGRQFPSLEQSGLSYVTLEPDSGAREGSEDLGLC